MNFRAMRVFDDVAIGDDAICIDEEAAAARQFFAARIESLNRDRRWFNAANEFGKNIL
jgi:hypothetical protein